MSWLRTKMASNSPPSEAVSARSPFARISSPASAKTPLTSSASLPLLGSAMRNMKDLVSFGS